MDDFKNYLEESRKGLNSGLITDFKQISDAINNIQRGTLYVVFGQPKSFKTKWTDTYFVLYPFLRNNPDNIDIVYYSWEGTKFNKIADWISFFFWQDYRLKYSSSHVIQRGKYKVKDEHLKYVDKILQERIVPLIGEYDSNGIRTKKGLIDFIEERNNPTGVRNQLINKFAEQGTPIEEDYFTFDELKNKVKKKKIVSYRPDNPNRYSLVIVDHIRKFRSEKGFGEKEIMDKWSDYTVELSSIYNCSFVTLAHANRTLSDKETTQSQGGKYLRPHPDMLKGSGNLTEDCHVLLGLFNPYLYPHISTHFGYNLDKFKSDERGKYRSIHVLANRYGEAPLDFSMTVDGGNNLFSEIPKPGTPQYQKFCEEFLKYENKDYG